ncbi:MAG: prolyl oligopeptidase family serine peptidase [Thermoguttaceae bacterium]
MKLLRVFLAACVVSCLAIAAAAAEKVEIIPDVVYGHKDGLAMTFDVLQPTQNANGAGILSLQSGAWFSGYNAPKNFIDGWRAMLDKGFTIFIVYHGSGSKYFLPDIVNDLHRSVRFIRAHAARFGVDPRRLGAFGGSSGGHLTLMLATTGDDGDPKAGDELLRTSDRLAAAVAYYPPTDIRPWFKTNRWKDYPAFRFDPALAGKFSPLLLVSARTPPTLLIHGDKDPVVPLEHSQKILPVLQGDHVPSELLVIKGAGHGFGGGDAKRAAEARNAWFEKYLLPAKP